MMKYAWWKKSLALASVLALLTAGAAARQRSSGTVTKEEEAEARAAAAAFADRLRATNDFASVARELYADDFMSRQLKGLHDWSGRAPSNTFMLGGIPSLTFERALAAKASAEEWKRLRLAADNLLYFAYLSILSRHRFEDLSDPGKFDDDAILAVFPPEAVAALNVNPALANFLKKKGGQVVVRTPEELRATADALEEAVRLTRPRLAESLAKGKHLDTNLRLFGEGFARSPVGLSEGEEAAGYPAGTRLFRVFAPNAYSLLLVRQGGALKIVWASLPAD
jgi:hypothetical protein